MKDVSILSMGVLLSKSVCALVAVLMGLEVWWPGKLEAANVGATFSGPQDAAQALASAAHSKDRTALRNLFARDTDDLVGVDQVQSTNDWEAFARAYDAHHLLLQESDSRYVLEVGTNAWPFPIPIVKRDGRWCFDTEAGKEELLKRFIGRNELATLQVMRCYVEAQREYARADRDNDSVLEYAQALGSAPGLKNGLYWPPGLDGEESPLGPLIALAQARGYDLPPPDGGTSRAPFQGYYFKILTRQGKRAPGGAYNYIINGNMIGGFALLAWPAQYGESGIMTFTVNQQGVVYQKDLGPKTDKLAAAMRQYDLDSTWQLSPD